MPCAIVHLDGGEAWTGAQQTRAMLTDMFDLSAKPYFIGWMVRYLENCATLEWDMPVMCSLQVTDDIIKEFDPHPFIERKG